MSILPAKETAYRRKIRRRLTLDLFTREGLFWDYIAEMREEWRVTPVTRIPPAPTFHAASVDLLPEEAMPERFHMPDADPERPLYDMPAWAIAAIHPILSAMILENPERLRATRFLAHIEQIWRACIREDVRSGTNAWGFLSWAPFLSACVLYDPPAEDLLTFADHDDVEAAAMPHETFWQDPEGASAAALELNTLHKTGDVAAWRRSVECYAESWQPSDQARQPTGKRGRPSDDLQDVQCAIWRRLGMSSAEIGRRIDRGVRDNAGEYEPGTASHRERSDAAEAAWSRGRAILDRRDAWARLIE